MIMEYVLFFMCWVLDWSLIFFMKWLRGEEQPYPPNTTI
ncbi:hypothetical protein J2W44_005149 [Priestia aryabhattai]|nr:hypothetical protein [Priestia aryabhattai]